jgi:hypothetical protein
MNHGVYVPAKHNLENRYICLVIYQVLTLNI